jgi:hypothetical protein
MKSRLVSEVIIARPFLFCSTVALPNGWSALAEDRDFALQNACQFCPNGQKQLSVGGFTGRVKRIESRL